MLLLPREVLSPDTHPGIMVSSPDMGSPGPIGQTDELHLELRADGVGFVSVDEEIPEESACFHFHFASPGNGGNLEELYKGRENGPARSKVTRIAEQRS
ncbi:hypothetical protein GRJ2_001321800 [Grus japonensis]|uniref:Uncharacterized protein n=1 Tax=Grus japonensis TaxID=30415 RepID=A0ABC9WTV0_GRUJA